MLSIRHNWDSPTPSPAGVCAPRGPLVPGGGTLAGGRGGGGVPIRTRGQTLWYSRYRIYLLCGADVPPYILLDSWASLMVFTVSTVLGTPHHALEEDQMIAPAAQEAQQQHQNRQNNLYR